MDPLTHELDLTFLGSVHVEALPDDGLAEAKWVERLDDTNTMTTTIRTIAASCDLTQGVDRVRDTLAQLRESCPRVRGVRWILDVNANNEQEYVPNTATHVACQRHDLKQFGTIDYLKVPAFQQGVACLLQQQGSAPYSFDLQCAPCQLQQAA